jgi:hypothetical protein
MNYQATLDFVGIRDLYGKFKRGGVYDFKENETTKLLLKIGYIKEVNVSVTEKELKPTYETKELKVKKKTKKNA